MACMGQSWAKGRIDIQAGVVGTERLERALKKVDFERYHSSRTTVRVQGLPEEVYIPKEWISEEKKLGYPRIHLKILEALYLTVRKKNFLRLNFKIHRDRLPHEVDQEAGNVLLGYAKNIESKYKINYQRYR